MTDHTLWTRLEPLIGTFRAFEFVYGKDAADRFQRELDGQAHLITKPKGRPVAEKTLDLWHAIIDCMSRFDQMTVRGVFYQCASVYGVVPKTDKGPKHNSTGEPNGYEIVQRQLLKLRREHVVPWSFVVDGTRWRRQPAFSNSIEDALRETARLYRRDLWRSQGTRIEVWLEKEALADLLRDTTYGWGVSLMVSRGQTGDTYVHDAALEAQEAWDEYGIETVIFALYDSDYYGRNAVTNIEKKLADYSAGAPISVEFLAVTDEQIEEWQLPTRPGKALDRGRPVVELDAIPPDKLISLVDDAIRDQIVDGHAWRLAQAAEDSEREILQRMATS